MFITLELEDSFMSCSIFIIVSMLAPHWDDLFVYALAVMIPHGCHAIKRSHP